MNIRPCDLLSLLHVDMPFVDFEVILKDAQKARASFSKKLAEIRHVITLDIKEKINLTTNETSMLYALEEEYKQELGRLDMIIDFAYRSKSEEKSVPRSVSELISISKQVK